MADRDPKEPQFTVTDRRKFTFDGELREGHEHLADVKPEPAASHAPEPARGTSPDTKENQGAEPLLTRDTSVEDPHSTPSARRGPQALSQEDAAFNDEDLDDEDETDDEAVPAGPTAEQAAEGHVAYKASAQRIDDLVRASDPGAPREPELGFAHLVQTLYMGALMQMGAGTPQGEKMRVDIVGARQSIDMMDVLAKKTKGNLSKEEQQMLDAVLFELRMAFVRLTQAISQEAAGKAGAPPKPRSVR